MRGRRCRRNRDESPEDFGSTEESSGEFSHKSGSRCSREKSREFTKRLSNFLSRHKHHDAAMDAMSRALRRAARSPFSDEIE